MKFPWEWGHPQFDQANALAWGDFVRENPYVRSQTPLYRKP